MYYFEWGLGSIIGGDGEYQSPHLEISNVLYYDPFVFQTCTLPLIIENHGFPDLTPSPLIRWYNLCKVTNIFPDNNIGLCKKACAYFIPQFYFQKMAKTKHKIVGAVTNVCIFKIPSVIPLYLLAAPHHYKEKNIFFHFLYVFYNNIVTLLNSFGKTNQKYKYNNLYYSTLNAVQYHRDLGEHGGIIAFPILLGESF